MALDRMSTDDMLQYCDEALAWDQFGPVDIFFFESVKRILLGQCPAIEAPEEDDLAAVATPISAEELISYDADAASDLTELLDNAVFLNGSEHFVMTEEQKEETDAKL
ncbi:MAG: hypothetical protein IKI21_12025 [Oscillospiraceae bacterium]|nr:hypothetical protein [Oscillospiraceae bacterium]